MSKKPTQFADPKCFSCGQCNFKSANPRAYSGHMGKHNRAKPAAGDPVIVFPRGANRGTSVPAVSRAYVLDNGHSVLYKQTGPNELSKARQDLTKTVLMGRIGSG